MLQVSTESEISKKQVLQLHKATEKNPRTAELEPEKDPKMLYLKHQQEELSYVIKLNKAPIEEKIDLLQKRIQALDSDSPKYFDNIKKENELYHRIVDKPLSDRELAKKEEQLAKSIKSEAVANTHLTEAYKALKENDKSKAEEKFKLADEHLEKGIRFLYPGKD